MNENIEHVNDFFHEFKKTSKKVLSLLLKMHSLTSQKIYTKYKIYSLIQENILFRIFK